jgi:peptide/nickel transport system substrate-binding protein
MTGKSRLIAVVLTISVLVGAGFIGAALAADSSTAAASGKKITFTVGQTNDVRTFNPLKAIETPEYEVLAVVYDWLLGWDKDTMEPVPDLATKWTTSSDQLTWTFTIRSGVKWSDGQPLTAHDIAFTYNFILDKGFSSLSSYLANTDSITAPDDTTLVWKTTKPTTAPVAPPYISIMPEHVWSKFSKDQAKNYANFPDTVGSGPFKLVEWQKGDFWRLDANPDYWAGAPQIDELIFKVYKNAESMVNALKSGDIDIADSIPTDLFDSLQNTPGITAHKGSAQTFAQMSFNQCYVEAYCHEGSHVSTGHPALKDPQVRLAIATAINKQQLVDRILRGFGTPGTSVIPPIYPWHWQPTADETIPTGIEQANAILDQAGYMDTNNDGVREMPGGGEPLNFRFIVRSEEPNTVKAGHLIAGWLKQIGISVTPEAVTDGKLTDIWYANDYDLYIWGWGVEPDPDFQLSTYTTGQCGVWSDTCFSDPQYDKLYKEQKTTASRDERAQIVDQMQQIVYEKIPEIVLYYDNDLQAYRSDRWAGLVQQPQTDGQLIYQYGTFTYRDIRPIGAGGSAGASGGLSPIVWVGVAVGLIVIVAAVMIVRRRTSDEDRA